MCNLFVSRLKTKKNSKKIKFASFFSMSDNQNMANISKTIEYFEKSFRDNNIPYVIPHNLI